MKMTTQDLARGGKVELPCGVFTVTGVDAHCVEMRGARRGRYFANVVGAGLAGRPDALAFKVYDSRLRLLGSYALLPGGSVEECV